MKIMNDSLIIRGFCLFLAFAGRYPKDMPDLSTFFERGSTTQEPQLTPETGPPSFSSIQPSEDNCYNQ